MVYTAQYNCLVLKGTDAITPENFIVIEISPSAPVSDLQKAIVDMQGLGPHLTLFNVSACAFKPSTDLDLSALGDSLFPKAPSPEVKTHQLLATDRLHRIFPEPLDDSHLHIIVKAPIEELNCCFREDPNATAFAIKIEPQEKVSALKKAIKDVMGSRFDHVAAVDLVLWKAAFPVGEIRPQQLDGLEELQPLETLASLFMDGKSQDVHVIFDLRSTLRQTKSCPIVVDSDGELVKKHPDAVELIKTRDDYFKKFPKRPPSEIAAPSEISILQKPSSAHGILFHCNRPQAAEPPIPLTLLHPIFNEFLDDCNNCTTTQKDHSLVREISQVMSDFYGKEDRRQSKFLQIFLAHGIPIISTQITGTSYRTDGDMQTRGFPYLICEFKNEFGSTRSDPVFQMAAYYTAFLRSCRTLSAFSVYPCIGLYVVGCVLGFVGFGLGERVIIQVLGQPIRFDYHSTDAKLSLIVTRHLGALRKATLQLQGYYASSVFHLGPTATLPCYFKYTCFKSGLRSQVSYQSQMREKLVFFGEAGDSSPVCVKFVTRYSTEAHEICAKNGFAPTLRGFEKLPGGWFMVVMDSIDESFQPLYRLPRCHRTDALYQAALNKIMCLHQNNLAHGDVRETNLMVATHKPNECMLVDFDWAGQIGEFGHFDWKSHIFPLISGTERSRRICRNEDSNESASRRLSCAAGFDFKNQYSRPVGCHTGTAAGKACIVDVFPLPSTHATHAPVQPKTPHTGGNAPQPPPILQFLGRRLQWQLAKLIAETLTRANNQTNRRTYHSPMSRPLRLRPPPSSQQLDFASAGAKASVAAPNDASSTLLSRISPSPLSPAPHQEWTLPPLLGRMPSTRL
ncbi:hypothetical protein D9756_010741 [Leucocoprinus leucothites]|uniref:Crinkler effector protein N-terminal domain-containing protein n=1 Tax=Leucocoprinus leucothites TaxID=201217 RepID=A0A8H5CU96_9AGAR|nr:hypothetical protein D9756_010741 [Leucoagaricus leucothites]